MAKYKYLLAFLWLLILSTKIYAADYYWVGGSGNWSDINHWRTTSGGPSIPSVVPGPTDNVYFDVNSGFATTSRTVTLDVTGNCHNITFSGSAIAPTFIQNNTSQILNIYGSSEWQAGMPVVNIATIYYRNTGEAKTIKSNGVITGRPGISTLFNVYLEETNSISLLDDFNVNNNLNHQAGTWNTNDHMVTIFSDFIASSGASPRTINLGSSDIFMSGGSSVFNTSATATTLNAGTSHIHFTNFASATTLYGLIGRTGQVFYDVSLDNVNSPTGRIISGNNLSFHKVELKGSAIINGNNTFAQLILSPVKNYIIQSNSTQQITELFSFNTPSCDGWSSLASSNPGTAAVFSAPASAVITVGGVVMQDISGIGGAAFTANHSVDNGNNTGWNFPPNTGQNLYWVGGSGIWNDKSHWSQTSGGTGGYCVPGPGDNVFFDAGSGFIVGGSTVTLDGTGYVHNITFSGSSVSPTFTQNNANQILNIYGSSEWQSGMGTVNIGNIYYRNTGEVKTIKSNGVTTGRVGSVTTNNVYFEETNSISLLDDFNVNNNLYQRAGTWNTNDYKVTIRLDFYANNGASPRTMNLGSSDIFMSGGTSVFNTSSAAVTLNAGTSHIHFTNFVTTTTLYGLIGRTGQVFYDVSLDNVNSSIGQIISGNNLSFRRVELKGSATISGNNNFGELFLGTGKTYTFSNNSTQTIANLIVSGTPCSITFIQSGSIGTRANINVTAGSTDFNFVNIRDINASGLPLHFGEQSTDAGNNNNITFDPYNPGAFNGLGDDWVCHGIDDNDPSTYMLGSSGFFGNIYTTYKWYKLNDANYDPAIPISTANEVDIRTFGFGTYKIEVVYSDGTSATCQVSNQIMISEKTAIPTSSGTVCRKAVNTLAEVQVNGVGIKWYASSSAGTPLPITTPVLDGQIYYASQTIAGCESNRIAVTLAIKNCNSPMVNPGIRLKVKQ
ncbi:Ig-like domain-containing protein [Chryseobacterium sp. M5A1_1a]